MLPAPSVPPPAASLQLLDAGPLEIPPGCTPSRGTWYRASYVVQADGRVTDTQSTTGEACVQDALRRWVSTFAYRPITEPTPTVIDWMYVTAARGR